MTVQVTGSTLSNVTSSPLAISPAFAGTTTDYVLRCQPGINTVQLTLTAASGGTVTVGGRTGQVVELQESLIENQAIVISAPDPNNRAGSPVRYWIRCLPHDFPQLAVTKGEVPPPGWYLTGNIERTTGSDYYAMVLDTNGTPVWYRKPVGPPPVDVTALSDGTIAWWSNAGPDTGFENFNLATRTTRWLRAPDAPTDPHELQGLPNGDFVMLSNPRIRGVDMTAFGFSSNEDIIDCVVEETNAAGQLVWEWRASEHISVGESTFPLALSNGAYDVFHCNSVASDPVSGNVLLSARHLDAVYYIDKTTARVIWKMGGTPFSHDGAQIIRIDGDVEGAFHAQHDARFQPGGDISLYDNQTWNPSLAARGVEYHIDFGASTATPVWSYQSPDGHDSGATGSFQRLAGGADNVIAWGFKPGTLFTEVDADGKLLLDVSFVNGEFPYRAIKVGPTALDHELLRATAGLPPFSFTPDTDPVITASGATLTANEDKSFTNTVATFDDPDPTANASGFLATIAWGDGSSSTGSIGGPVGGPFSVTGSHTYPAPGTDVSTVYITRVNATSVKATATSTVNVADAPISASCAAPKTSLIWFSGTTATFTDADLTGSASDHRATIAWGDGSSSVGTVTGPDRGPFTVNATHAYASTGRFNLTTTINDVAGSSTSASCPALIYSFPPGAVAFAVGEKTITNGSVILFRTVPLPKLDSSSDEAPANFKDFWQKLAPTCGIDWATITGGSSSAVGSSVPDYMGVIVISPVRQSASRSSGITAHIVIVRTRAGQRHDSGDWGDQGDSRGPGDAGRGTVEAQVC